MQVQKPQEDFVAFPLLQVAPPDGNVPKRYFFIFSP